MPYTSKQPQDIYLTSFLKKTGSCDTFEPFEDTPEEYIEAIRDRRVCRYAVKTTKSGQWLEAELYPIWIATRDVPRGQKLAPSSEAQQNLNENNARRAFTRKVNENFTAWVDQWVTFTSDDDHLVRTEEEGQKVVKRFFDRARYLYKTKGLELKYAYAVEYKAARDHFKRPICDPDTGTPLIRLHIHAVLNGGVSDKDIADKWQSGSIVQIRPLQPRNTGYAGLARYITKKPKNGHRRYACSLNLRKPRQTVSYYNRAATKTAIQRLAKNECDREAWFERVYKDYRFVDCEAKFNEVNDGTYLYCRMELKDDAPPRRKKPKRNGRDEQAQDLGA